MLTLFTGLPKEDTSDPVINDPIDLSFKSTRAVGDQKKLRVGNTVLLRSQASKGLASLLDPELERDIRKLAWKYLKRDFFFDILANFPHLFYSLFNGLPESQEKIAAASNLKLFNICMGLKTLRLFHFFDVISSLTRFMNYMANIFYLHRYMFVNLLSWFKSGL